MVTKGKVRTPSEDTEADVEQRIQKALKNSPKSNKELQEETEADDRVLTRSLQRLRRRGKLRVVEGRWALTTIKICPECEGRGWIKE